MRDRRSFVVICAVCALLFFACEEYEGTISGNVVYMKNGVAEVAVDEIITKIQLKGGAEIVVAKEKTDTCGNYVLNHTAKGSWKVIGRLEIDSIVYEGTSDVIAVDGAEKSVQNLVLKPIKN
jgi:hypothetical protein